MTRRSDTRRRWARRHLWHTRTLIVFVWMLVALLAAAPAARALGLPFVDLPDAGSVASDAMDSASRAIVGMISSAVASLTNEIIKVSDTLAAPQVGTSNAWFTASYKRTMAVSLYLMAIAALIAISAAGIRGKVGEMVQVLLVSVPGAIIAMMLATTCVQLSLSLTDAMTAYTFRSSVGDIQTFLHDIGTVFTSTEGAAQPTSQLAPGLTLIIGLLVVVAQLVILAVLIVRSALIYIVTLFLPLVFAVQVWPATRHMTRKALELLAVLVFAKFAIFTCFALGAAATADVLSPSTASGAAPPVQSAIVGLGVMAAAAFSPMLLLSIIPGIAGSFGAGMPGGTAGAGALSVRTPSQIMRNTLSSIHTVRGGNTGGGGGQGAARGSSGTRGGDAGGTTRPPTGGASPGGGRGGSSSAAMEAAHSSPQTAAAAGAAKTLASGATSAAAAAMTPTRTSSQAGSEGQQQGASVGAGRSATAATQGGHGGQQSSGSTSAGRAVTSASGEGPHVVSGGGASSDRGVQTGSPRAGAGARAASPASSAVAPMSADGFSAIETRKPFTLETT